MTHLILLHGAIGASDQLEPLADLLRDSYQVHTLNFSGHGGSPFGASFGIHAFAEEVLAYCDQEQLEQVDIFGYSMGGYVAAYLARHHAHRIRKWMTLATKWEWSESIAAREVKMLNPLKIQEKVPTFAAALAQRHGEHNWVPLLEKTAEMMQEMGAHNPLSNDDLAAITAPAYVCLGDRDQMVSMTETLATVEVLNDRRLAVFPATHHPIEKVPLSRLAAEIRYFFEAEKS